MPARSTWAPAGIGAADSRGAGSTKRATWRARSRPAFTPRAPAATTTASTPTRPTPTSERRRSHAASGAPVGSDEAVGSAPVVPRTARLRSSRVGTATRVPSRVGSTSSGVFWARVSTTAIANRPSPVSAAAAGTGRELARCPIIAVMRAYTTNIEANRMSLSQVPNSPMTRSFTAGGTMSTTPPPTATKGAEEEPKARETSSATATSTSPATTPTSADQRPGARSGRCAGAGPDPLRGPAVPSSRSPSVAGAPRPLMSALPAPSGPWWAGPSRRRAPRSGRRRRPPGSRRDASSRRTGPRAARRW